MTAGALTRHHNCLFYRAVNVFTLFHLRGFYTYLPRITITPSTVIPTGSGKNTGILDKNHKARRRIKISFTNQLFLESTGYSRSILLSV